ncbi:MAG: hypothetical protein WD889_00935 [Candidatus Colwellbacteria bacterium]
MRKARIAILSGGPFAEHEVSVLSGEAVRRALAKTRYETTPVLIKRDGEWSVGPQKLKETADIVFVAMHGKYGEDGRVQDILGQAGILYTGSGALSSALAINKVLSGRLFRALGFETPRFMTLEKSDSGSFELDFDFPVIVKPINRGLSLGVGLAREPGELNDALGRAFEFSKSVLVEEYITGRELNVSVIDNGGGELVPMVPVEIIPRAASFHDYYSKLSPDISEVVIPALLGDKEKDLVQAAGLLVHQAIGAAGVSSTDMILGQDGRLYLLEANTIPSFIETGALVSAASGHGLSLTEVCERIVEAAYDSIRAD